MFDPTSQSIEPMQSPAGGSLQPRAPFLSFYAGLPPLRLLILEDDSAVGRICHDVARSMGFSVESCSRAREALVLIRRQSYDLLLLDLKLPDGNGLEVFSEVRARHPKARVVVMTAFATVSSAVEAMRIGADDYLTKPFGLSDLKDVLDRATQRIHFDAASRMLHERLQTSRGLGSLIGTSPEMQKVYRILSKVACSSHPVLILGESGTGKEIVARTIHESGPLAANPFVTIECSLLSAASAESTLFGDCAGEVASASGAFANGLLVSAGRGTVLLDEVGELPLDVQAKLVRAIQEKVIRPVGSDQAIPFNARILASSSRDLMHMMERGHFRKDLYYRLNIVNLKLAPLRERREDIPVLAQHFLERAERESGKSYRLSEDCLRIILEYDWPGNVRELQNAMERTCALSSGPVLHTVDLPTQLQNFHEQRRAMGNDAGSQAGRDGGASIISISEMEKKAILATIRQLNGDKMMAARLLGIGKTTLYRKLKEYGLTDAEFSQQN